MSNKYIQLAKQIAISGRSRNKGYHLGAVCKRNDSSLTTGYNTRSNNRNPFVHAEAKAIYKAGNGAKLLVVVRVLADNSLALARPCEDCQKLIKSMGVEKVIYSISSNEYTTWYPLKEKI